MIIIIYFYNYQYQSNSIYKEQFHFIFVDGPPWIIIGAAAGGAVLVIAIVVLLMCCLRKGKKGEQLKYVSHFKLAQRSLVDQKIHNLALKNTWLQTYHKRLQNPLTNFKSPLVIISSFKSERKLIVLVQKAATNVFPYLFILIVLSTCLRDVPLHDLEGGSDTL